MSKNRVLQPDFKLSFLLPQYWPTWIGVFVLYSISWLPYKLQLGLGRLVGRLLAKTGTSRVKVARRNLELCFPEKSAQEIDRIVKKNFENAGVALLKQVWVGGGPIGELNAKLKSLAKSTLTLPTQTVKGCYYLLCII